MAKVARLDLRLQPQHKSLLEQAAALQGSSLSEFTTAAALDKARALIAQQGRIEINQQAFEHLVDELQRPAKPLPSLLEQLRKVQ